MLERQLRPAQDFIENATPPAAPMPRSGFVHGPKTAVEGPHRNGHSSGRLHLRKRRGISADRVILDRIERRLPNPSQW